MKRPLNTIEAKDHILREFRFLVEDCDFGVIDVTEKPCLSITYKNATTALRVGYEPVDRGVFVLLIRLVHGQIPPYPLHIRPPDIIDIFYLDDLVALRGKKLRTSDMRVRSWKESIAQAASELRTSATDVLRGDFEVFLELDKIVKSR